jgi:hypothetical protein
MELAPMINHAKPHIIPPYSQQEYDQAITEIYAKNADDLDRNIETQIKIFGALFLGMPYILGALGEGPGADFDKSPLYRTDGFDCTTYVATVLALAFSKNLSKFQENIIKINYRDNHVAYVQRNHFMEVDWNSNNQRLGFLQDITSHFVDAAGKPVASIAKTIIDKPSWYRMKNAGTIKTFEPLADVSLQKLIDDLHALSTVVQSTNSQMFYLPLTALFDASGVPNENLLNQIPSASVIEIVRPDWNLKMSIGTNLNVSHMGFAIRDERGLVFRDASTITHTVRDILLVDYLREYLDHPTIRGIHVQKVLDNIRHSRESGNPS